MDTCSVDPRTTSLQSYKKCKYRPNHERHFGFLNMSNIFEGEQKIKTIFKK